MAISKLILNGNVQMDVTGTTAIESDVRTGKKFTKVNGVEATGTDPGASLQSSKTATPSTSQQTILPDSGYDGLEQVVVNAMPSGSAGTPTATKGTVSNHSISVTPSVTNTTGYITGGTKTGTAVTVTASELVSGTLSVASNGTVDVTNYASANVSVVETYTATITSVSLGSESSLYVICPYPGGTKYYQAGDTFEFAQGDTLRCFVSVRGSGAYIYLNSQIVAGSASATSAGYEYTLPAKDIEIDLYYDFDDAYIGILESVIPLAFLGAQTWGGYSAIIPSGTYLTGDQTIPESGYSIYDLAQPYAWYPGALYDESVTQITNFAFAARSGVSYAEFPNCTEILTSAFYSCVNLSGISFSACTSVASYAFAYCSTLANINMPNVTRISGHAFDGCKSLVSVNFPSCQYMSNDYTFAYCSKLKTVSLPLVSEIGQYTFRQCSALENVYLSQCQIIYNNAFEGCTGLSYIDLPNCTIMRSSVFAGCSNLEAISAPNLMGTMSYTFDGCIKLKSVYFPASGMAGNPFGMYAFRSCYALESVNIPYLEIVGSYVFQYCSALSYVSLPNCSTLYVYAFANTGLPSIYLPECLIIGTGVFASDYNLSLCSFPIVSKINTSAFLNCNSLSTVIIGTSFSASATGVYISGTAFGSCYNLLSLYILSGEYQLSTTAFVNTPISNNTTSTGGIHGSIFMPSSLYSIYYSKIYWSVYKDRMVSLTDAQIQNVLTYGRHNP